MTEGSSNGMLAFVEAAMGGVTTNVNLTMIAAVVAAIIGAGVLSMFAWKFARKGYHFVKNALAGRNGKI